MSLDKCEKEKRPQGKSQFMYIGIYQWYMYIWICVYVSVCKGTRQNREKEKWHRLKPRGLA